MAVNVNATFIRGSGGELAGIDENPREVGAAAVDYVAGMIHRNERGVPLLPQRVLIDGTWVDGGTVRAAAGIR